MRVVFFFKMLSAFTDFKKVYNLVYRTLSNIVKINFLFLAVSAASFGYVVGYLYYGSSELFS